MFPWSFNPACIYFLKFSNGNTRAMREICSVWTITTPKLRWRCSDVFIVNVEHIFLIAHVFPLLTLNKQLPVGKWLHSHQYNYYRKVSVAKVFNSFDKMQLFAEIIALQIHWLVSVWWQLWRLRILKGKKHRQIKLQRLQKVQIWAFGSLVHQMNFLEEVFKLKQSF